MTVQSHAVTFTCDLDIAALSMKRRRSRVGPGSGSRLKGGGKGYRGVEEVQGEDKVQIEGLVCVSKGFKKVQVCLGVKGSSSGSGGGLGGGGCQMLSTPEGELLCVGLVPNRSSIY